MATKAELQTELENLRRELKQHKEETRSEAPVRVSSKDQQPASDTDDLRQLLDEQGIESDKVDSLGAKLLEELAAIQKEKPLIAVVAAFALGCVVGRAIK